MPVTRWRITLFPLILAAMAGVLGLVVGMAVRKAPAPYEGSTLVRRLEAEGVNLAVRLRAAGRLGQGEDAGLVEAAARLEAAGADPRDLEFILWRTRRHTGSDAAGYPEDATASAAAADAASMAADAAASAGPEPAEARPVTKPTVLIDPPPTPPPTVTPKPKK